MYGHRYTPQAWERHVLAAQMEIFIKLVGRVDFITHLNTARMMLRGLETAARRLVLVLALMAPRLKPIAPKPMSPAQARRLAAPSGLLMPSRRFRLIEPMPMTVVLQRACAHDTGPPMTHIALTSLGLAQHYAPPIHTPAPFEEITPWDRVMARLDALKDVVQQPEHHAMRLRRWMARQNGLNAAKRFARTSPLLFGRPNTLKKADFLHPTRRPSDPLQLLIWETDRMAHRAQAPP